MISTERMPVMRAVVVDHRRVHRLALEQVGERVAHHVAGFQHRPERRVGVVGDGVAGQVALGQPAGRAVAASSTSRA